MQTLRSLWKGTISFGLVTIPVKLYAATEEKNVKFNYLHGECHTPVRYVKWCPNCNREVQMQEIVRGYEYEPGRFVVLQDEDFERLPTALARTVEILDFVNLADIDPIYFLKTYFLEPAEGGAKAYSLLRRAMQETGRIALARVALRGRATLAGIRVYRDQALTMETMHFPDEIREFAGLSIPREEGLRDQELDMAKMLIGTLSGEFVPEKFEDDYRRAVVELIREKVAGEQVVRVEAPEATTRVVDLMEALRQSIQVAKEARAGAGIRGGGAGPDGPGAVPPAEPPAPGPAPWPFAPGGPH